ncbi:MAG: hypothetical protein WEB88_11305 [Gemmatimonadota bacterium]
MSSEEDRAPRTGGAVGPAASPPGWDRLEASVRRLLDAYVDARRRAAAAEGRAAELQGKLADLSSGRVDPLALSARADEMEAENARLRQRLERAGAVVERMKTRVQLAEDER